MRFEEISTLSRVCDSLDAPMGGGIREAERAEQEDEYGYAGCIVGKNSNAVRRRSGATAVVTADDYFTGNTDEESIAPNQIGYVRPSGIAATIERSSAHAALFMSRRERNIQHAGVATLVTSRSDQVWLNRPAQPDLMRAAA